MVLTTDLRNAINRLEEALNEPKNDFLRDSVIQRFEFCVELAWKTSKKVMGSNSTAPKTVVREMAQNNLIDNVVLWLESIDKRNLSSHSYKEDLAEEIYLFAKNFLPELQVLIQKLDELNR